MIRKTTIYNNLNHEREIEMWGFPVKKNCMLSNINNLQNTKYTPEIIFYSFRIFSNCLQFNSADNIKFNTFRFSVTSCTWFRKLYFSWHVVSIYKTLKARTFSIE